MCTCYATSTAYTYIVAYNTATHGAVDLITSLQHCLSYTFRIVCKQKCEQTGTQLLAKKTELENKISQLQKM